MDDTTLEDGTTVRFLRAEEGATVGEAIRAAYGDSYDADWVYDADEVGRRIDAGLFISCVAEAGDGSLLCHAGLSRTSLEDMVGEAGQAVTMPAARGHHLFQAVKRHLGDWANEAGLFGMFSEVTTAHPYSEKANLDLGAQETGFLLGWIPATVANNASSTSTSGTAEANGTDGTDGSTVDPRRSVALFYLKTNDGHRRPVFAPDRHRDVVGDIIERCGLRGELAVATDGIAPDSTSTIATEIREDHNIAIVNVLSAGADIVDVVRAARADLFGRAIDVLYVDLALDDPLTEAAGERLEDAGVSFAGLFPNRRVDGDVLRLQAFNGLRFTQDDVTTASDHGRQLLDYVLADIPR